MATTTARTYARSVNTLNQHRAAALEYVNLGKLDRAAREMRRGFNTDTRVIAANLTALNRLKNRAGLTARERAIASGIAAQCAMNAIRSSTRREIRAMTLTELAALLEDTARTPTENEIAVDNLHDRYEEKIGNAAYDAHLADWIDNGTPGSEIHTMILAELTAA